MSTLRDYMRNPLGERAGVRLQDLDRAIGDLAGREFLDAACGPFVVSLPPNPFPWESEPGAKPSLAKRLESLQANAPRLGKLTVHAIGAAVLAQDLDPRSGLDVGRPGGVASLQLPGSSISKRHARLTQLDDGSWELSDLNSTNGTKVEGRGVTSVSPAPLRSGMRVTFGTHDTLFLEDKHLFVLLRKVEIDLEAPVGNVVGVTVPAEGVRMRKLASKVARLPTKKFLQRCWSWFLLEVPTETGPGKVAPGAVRGRTVSLRKTEVLEAKRGKSSQARVFVLASRHGEKDRVLVGRDARRCDLVIEHPSVSGVHADLRWTGEAWQVTDCESENGTFVSEERLTPGDAAFLNARQPIYFGGYRTVLLSAEDLHGFAVRLAGG